MNALIFTKLNNKYMWAGRNDEHNATNYGTCVFEGVDAEEAFQLSEDNPYALVYIKDDLAYWELQNGKVTEIIRDGFYHTLLEIHSLCDLHGPKGQGKLIA